MDKEKAIKIKEMLKLIPNNFGAVNLEDLKEIFKQDERINL
jgi:hypothetical protein